MQFLYFIPGVTHASPALLAEYGLSGVLGGSVRQGAVGKGPGGLPGTLLASGTGQGLANLRVDDGLTWRPGLMRDGAAAWSLGWRESDPPTEAQLRRQHVLDGRELVLGDGGSWTVPVARLYDGTANLPVRFSLGPDGQAAAGVLAAYRDLWERACRMPAVLTDPAGLSFDEAINHAGMILSASYRVGPQECLALGLFTTQNVAQVCRTVCDFDALLAAAAASASLPPGGGSDDDEEKKNSGSGVGGRPPGL